MNQLIIKFMIYFYFFLIKFKPFKTMSSIKSNNVEVYNKELMNQIKDYQLKGLLIPGCIVFIA